MFILRIFLSIFYFDKEFRFKFFIILVFWLEEYLFFFYFWRFILFIVSYVNGSLFIGYIILKLKIWFVLCVILMVFNVVFIK